MRSKIVLSAASIGFLIACGPISVDLGGGSGGSGTGEAGAQSTGGTGGSPYAGAGGGFATGGTYGEEGYCGDGVVQYPEACDDPLDLECPSDCGIVGGGGGTDGATGGTDGATGGTGGTDGATGGTGGTDGEIGGSGGTYGYAGSPGVGVCGDGVIDPGENCDDGNTVEDDGCSANCWYVEGGAGGTTGWPGSGGSAGAPNDSCVTEIVQAPSGECSDNDVLFGRAYERCEALARDLVTVRFTNPCGEYSSYSMEIDCCDQATGAAGSSASGGSGGTSSSGGSGGSN
jgi:cysteine-rich repeat protein